MECLGLFVSSFIRVSKREWDGERERAREREMVMEIMHGWCIQEVCETASYKEQETRINVGH